LTRFHPSSTWNVEIIIASAGIIWITSTPRMSERRLRNWNRLSASAPRKAKSSAKTTTLSVTSSEMRSAGMKSIDLVPGVRTVT
jgi:exosome complex RNA-binding protein Rrp4